MFGDRRRLLMSGGAIAVLVIGLWAMWPTSAAPTAQTPVAAPRGATPAAPVPVAPVKLATLAEQRAEPADADRNPFRYQQRVVPPPPVKSVGETPVPTFTEVPTKPMVPTGPPPPPPIPLKFIGLMERSNGVKWAVLTDGKVVSQGREGDVVDGRYRIVKIGTESIELTYVDGRGRQVVRLTGQ